MANGITWPKAMREHAKVNGQALFAFGYEGTGGRAYFHGPRDERQARMSFKMVMKLHHGMDLDEAAAEVKAEMAEWDERQAAKGTEAATNA